ncbi:MAG: DUF3347 domain-containing protein [Cryomorphaceae bacterium]
MRIKISHFALSIGLAVVTTSCGNMESTDKSDKPENTSIQPAQEPDMLSSYLQLKDALVQSDSEAARRAAERLVSQIPVGQSELLNNLRLQAQQIIDTDDTDEQRVQFNALSDNFYQWVKNTEANQSKLYRQYCPMAFDNAGAYWLSAEKEINNPYFGDKMLRCGSVREEL